MLKVDGKMNMVKCCVFLQIESRDKFLVSKLGSLQKHFGKHINARLQNQIVTRGSITCLLNHNM
jgi:hypothetical protein